MRMEWVWMTMCLLFAGFTVSAAGFAGTWKRSFESQQGPINLTITIEPGTELAGKVSVGEYEGKISNGKISGDNLSFETSISAGTLTFEGSAAGDELKLNVTGTQGNKYTLVCKRQR